MARVTVVGLGPGADHLVTAGTLAHIERVAVRFGRTARHPSAHLLGDAEWFDGVYERAAEIGDVYREIVDRLVRAAHIDDEVLYAVPGSPGVAEHTTELLLADDRVEVVVEPAMSFADLAWTRLGQDPVALGAAVVDGHGLADGSTVLRGAALVAQCDRIDVLSDLKLSVDPWPERRPVVLQRLGCADESIVEVAWEDLDRVVVPDHLTSVFVADVEPVDALAQFRFLVSELRARCPWDRAQTHESLRRYLLEETYELLEAIESGDPDHLREELGDVLFQVVFHAQIASESGGFDLDDVALDVHDKLRARHPHVFGDEPTPDPADLPANWERAKRAEKGRESAMDEIPSTLPGLSYAQKVTQRAVRAGLAEPADTESAAPVDPGPLDTPDAVGDVLLDIVERAAAAGIDAELAVRGAAVRAVTRYRAVEAGRPPA